MPPKVKVSKEEIINTAISLIRKSGASAVNARSIAAELGCSTQPIFSNFASMEELDNEVVRSAYALYLGFLEREAERGEYPQYKSFGMAYIRFAEEERELFKLLFMCDRAGAEIAPTLDFEKSVEIIMNTNGLSREQAQLLHMEMWSCVHGIGTMLATSFLTLKRELISKMLSDVYIGLRDIHVKEQVE